MAFIDTIYERAKRNKQRVAVPECTNPSMMRAAVRAAADGLADVVFVGKLAEIEQIAQENGLDLSGITVVDIDDEAYKADVLERYNALPKKILSKGYIAKKLDRPLYMALTMEAAGDIDCTFGGLDTTTAEFVMVANGILGLAEGCFAASSISFLEILDYEGEQGNIFGISDGAINTEPTSEQLASIATASCDSFTALTGEKARCAFLSYSTDGSGDSPSVFRVREARDMAQAMRPDLAIDGEFQSDAALNPRVAAKKVKRESEVAGKANVLVFPDASGCNVAGKLIQQFAKCLGYGPVYQGFRKAVLDCSRGDTEERIYANFALCSVMAAYTNKTEEKQ